MFFSRPAGIKYVNRGDPTAYDFSVANFTTDNTWRDLDLSTIIGIGEKLVILRGVISCSDALSNIAFKKKGLINEHNRSRRYVPNINEPLDYDILVPCNSEGMVQYKGQNDTWTILNYIVLGWFV